MSRYGEAMSAIERFEYTTVTASTFDAAALATKLTAHSAQGWDVVTIVSTGSELTAFCRRPATGEVPASTSQMPSSVSHPTPQAASMSTPATPTSLSPVAPEPAPSYSAANATPAGWYADPSGRYELRYWDGSAWTEHVARNGQQFTDPPVA
jgi:hypothetical protein